MNKELTSPNSIRRIRKPLRIGFLPLVDCAPLVMAHELGLFEKYQVDVELRREIGWGNVRDKILYGELDAAHAPAALPFARLRPNPGRPRRFPPGHFRPGQGVPGRRSQKNHRRNQS